MSEYLLHGTNFESCISCIRNRQISVNPKPRFRQMSENSFRQIFTQIIFPNIPNQANQNPFWYNCCFILDKKILRDLPFYANHIGRFADTFDIGVHRSSNIITSRKKTKQIPRIDQLKEHINTTMSNKKLKKLGTLRFMHSHEIIFGNDIDLEAYCVAIIYFGYKHQTHINKITQIAKKHLPSIPVITIESIGIDNLIECLSRNK